jgi:hypothetical protein
MPGSHIGVQAFWRSASLCKPWLQIQEEFTAAPEGTSDTDGKPKLGRGHLSCEQNRNRDPF